MKYVVVWVPWQVKALAETGACNINININITSTRVDGDGFAFTEVTSRDLRYLEQSKVITNSWAKGAERLEGGTSFSYDVNGNLSALDRGRKTGAAQNSASFFDYDLEGHIIGRADKATSLTNASYFAGYTSDPAATSSYDEYGSGAASLLQQIQQQQLGGAGSASTSLQSYLYANNKSLAQAQGTQQVTLKSLALVGGQSTLDIDGGITGWSLRLESGDIQSTNGAVDRNATALQIASTHYSGFSALSVTAQAKVVAYVLAQLPPDAQLVVGTKISLHGFIVLADASLSNLTQITDYSLRQIGADGLPGGSLQSHTVRAGDTLQSIAQVYFGSPAYWYLIADANDSGTRSPVSHKAIAISPPSQIQLLQTI
jgi:LysM domain